jgi:polyhydroxyalkanoate synthesis repressor PhaR
MAKSEEPIVIKKYANRRLYNTGTSTYVTLEDLAVMVKAGEDFVVYDAKTGEDITRSVLAQIIFEQENKEGQSLREQVAQAFGATGFGTLEDQVRRNMEMFQRAFTMFAPFARKENQTPEGEKPPPRGGSEIDDLKRQLDEMQRRLDRMGDKDKV